MTAKAIAIETGNKSVTEVSEITATADATLRDMARKYPARYRAVCIGAAVMRYGIEHLLQEHMKKNLHKIFAEKPADTETK